MKYHPYLESQLKQIEKDLNSNLSTNRQNDDNFLTEQEAKTLIRDKALQIYKLGINYVCKFFNIEPFMTNEDFAPIGKITDDVYRVYAYGGRLDSALISLTSITLAKAIKSKSLQIVSNPQYYMLTAKVVRPKVATPRPVVKSVPLLLPPIEEDFAPVDTTDNTDNIDNAPSDSTDQQLHSLMVWITEHDNLVCPICDALDGQTWEIDDPNIPEPVQNTHPNCRCRLDLQQSDTITTNG